MSAESTILSSRFRGCLLGLAVGDALGRPVEHSGDPGDSDWPKEASTYITACLASLADGKAPLEEKDAWPSFGQVTDDTQLATALARSLIAIPGIVTVDVEDFGKRLVELLENGCIYGIGKTTCVAIRLLSTDTKGWRSSGGEGPSNGSAMRVAPLALVLYKATQDILVQQVTLQSLPTHRHPEAIAGAVAIAAAVVYCLNAKPSKMDPLDFAVDLIDSVVLAVSAVEGGDRVTQAVNAVKQWLFLSPEEALAKLAQLDPRSTQECGTRAGVSGDAAASVAWALWAFAAHPDSFVDTVCSAVRGGGDADTTAAMAGAISGAYLGDTQIPTLWSSCLHDDFPGIGGRPELAIDPSVLKQLADSCGELALQRPWTDHSVTK